MYILRYLHSHVTLCSFINKPTLCDNHGVRGCCCCCCCRNTRFRGRSQQDSHELFRALLDGIRTEEAEVTVHLCVCLCVMCVSLQLVRKAIDQKLAVSPMDGETKLMKKGLYLYYPLCNG